MNQFTRIAKDDDLQAEIARAKRERIGKLGGQSTVGPQLGSAPAIRLVITNSLVPLHNPRLRAPQQTQNTQVTTSLRQFTIERKNLC